MVFEHERLEQLRARAEAAVQQASHSPQVALEDIQELMYELEVHGVELELQNRELQETQRHLEDTKREYEHLFTFAPLAYLILDQQGIIRKLNITAEAQFEMSSMLLEGIRLADLVAPEHADNFYQHMRSVRVRRQRQMTECIFIKGDGRRFDAVVESVPVATNEDSALSIRVALTDITHRKRYERRLHALSALNKAMVRSSSVGEVVEVALKHLLAATDCCQASVSIEDVDHRFVHIYSQACDAPSASFESRPTADGERRVLEEFLSLNEPLLIMPVIQGVQHGSLLLRGPAGHRFDDGDVQLARETAQQLAIGIQKVRLLQQVQAYATDLEQRVVERTRELHEREQGEHEQRVFAEAMLNSVSALNSTLELDEVLDRVLANLAHVVSFEMASVLLLHEGSAEIAKWRGKPGLQPMDGAAVNPREVPAYRHICETQQMLVVPPEDQARWWAGSPQGEGSDTYIGVPIRSDGEIRGILNVLVAPGQRLTTRQAEQLNAFADHAAIAINNALLARQKQQLAALEERQRFGRDLHDAVSQSLFSLSLLAESVPNLKQESQRLKVLKAITTMAQGAHAEMRLLLFELRSHDSDRIALEGLLGQLVLAFRARKDQQIRFHASESLPELPNEMKIQLYRIAQEALNNVIKHAPASQVDVSLTVEGEQLILRVRDTGSGFAFEAQRHVSHGLSIMHERAESIEAQLDINSGPGQGTEVRVIVPSAGWKRATGHSSHSTGEPGADE